MKGINETAMGPGLLGLAKALEGQRIFGKTFENPILEVAKSLSSTTAIFGLTAAFQQHQNIAKAFQTPLLDIMPSLSNIMKQHLEMSRTIAETMKGYQPFNLGLANQIKAMELSTHFTSLAIPKGLIDSLRDLDTWKEEPAADDDEITSQLEAIAIADGENALENLDRIQSILNVIRSQIAILITSTTDATEKVKRLVTYDRVVNHLGFILSILMYFVQAGDQESTTSAIGHVQQETALIHQDTEALKERVCDIQNDLQTLMTIIAEPDLRVCVKHTFLKNSANNSSVTIGMVEEYQLISVVPLPEEQRTKKWIYITYFDNHSGEPKAGWVLQKYFKRSKVNRRF